MEIPEKYRKLIWILIHFYPKTLALSTEHTLLKPLIKTLEEKIYLHSTN